MKNLIMSMAFAMFSIAGYSQSVTVNVINNTAEVLTVGAVSCTQPLPCVPVSSDDILVACCGGTGSMTLAPGYIIQRVGAGCLPLGNGYSMNPAISYGGCGISMPGVYTFNWTSPNDVVIF